MSGRGPSLKSKVLISVSYTILEQIQPASVRSICYQIFNRKIISSMKTSETQKVSRLLVYAREEGLIPWEWIVDETRAPERVASWDDLSDYGQAVVRSYRKDFWRYQPERVEVWSEKGTVRGVLAPVLKEFAVSFSVKHGFDSATSINDIADQTCGHGRPLIALYVGDWNPSGLCMSEKDLPQRLDRYGANVDLQRIALIESDVNYGGLPPFPADTKNKDPRHRWFVDNYGDECWELDALPPPVLRERVRNAILQHIDIEAWNHCAKVEAAELENLRAFNWKGLFSDQSQNSGGAMTAMPPLIAIIQGRKARRRKAPSVRPLESRLQIDVAKLLADHLLPDWRHSHFPAGERRDVITGARLKRMGLQRGWPDFLLISPTGQLHCLDTIDEVLIVLDRWRCLRVTIGGAACGLRSAVRDEARRLGRSAAARHASFARKLASCPMDRPQNSTAGLFARRRHVHDFPMVCRGGNRNRENPFWHGDRCRGFLRKRRLVLGRAAQGARHVSRRELPIETFKERMEMIAARYGRNLQFYGYNRDQLGDEAMPPLNTEAGQKWLWREIEIVKPDLIEFDSIMALLIGDLMTPEAWAPMLPVVRTLSAKHIAQIWFHHANEMGKGFGTKTREWEMIVRTEFLNAYDRLADGLPKSPGLNGKPVLKVSVDAIRDELKTRGFIPLDERGNMTTAGRNMLWTAKTELLKTKLVEKEGLIWRA